MAGRPESKIDWAQADKLLEAGCNGTEVAAFFGCHANTLYRQCEAAYGCNFSVYAQEKRAKGDSLLRTAQYKSAMAGNTSMQIWLGKNRLHQADEQNINQSLIIKTVDYSKAEEQLDNQSRTS